VAAIGAWATLDAPWREAFQLAWEAFGAGTIPVGAVVVDESGTVVTRGRNRIFETTAAPGQLAGTRLAHAEVNALAQLPPTKRHDRSTLYTTVEPCVLCVGATSLATVGRIVFAAQDVHSGGSGLLEVKFAVPRQLSLVIEGPLGGPLESVVEALHLAFFVGHPPHGEAFVRTYREQRPDLFALAETLIDLHALTLEDALAAIGHPDGGG
jgi:tRNA(Arg) A34 adenosine deaminase TadA